MIKPSSKMGRRRILLGGAAVTALLGASGCGWILYPERKGRTGGNIDVPILVVDLLWLIPGLIPGIICLVVDFSTGCIYRGSGRASLAPPTGEPDRRLATATVDVDGAIVANAEVRPDRRTHLRWNRKIDDGAVKSRGRLILQRPDGATAQALVADLI